MSSAYTWITSAVRTAFSKSSKATVRMRRYTHLQHRHPRQSHEVANAAHEEINRFKGLGEMNAKQLFETTMDPNKRTLLQQVKLDESNAHEADRIRTILMGDVVEPRKNFIEENALNVRNLDVLA